MAEVEEDSESEVEEYSGMEQPPLIKQLKTILAEYPDDGQIIKELIQNAEDAGATCMKILYDNRDINKVFEKKIQYRKFFKGPALCFYNDAVFSADDWRGIKMIYSSVKEENPMKVGRFGLGFKSVFHMTDNPCIISGNKLLLLNPHEKIPDKVCITIDLAKLKKCKRLKLQDILEALNDKFDFSEDVVNTGTYNGTIFWFPLRETASDLSDTVYDLRKVLDLFTSFKTEAVNCLLFLNSLCSVEVFGYSSNKQYDLWGRQACFSVKIKNWQKDVREERARFVRNTKNCKEKVPEKSIVSVTQPTVQMKDVHDDKEEETTWLVMNMYKGGDMSDKLSRLSNDTDLSYSPRVGAATKLNDSSENFKGHIFCFLPLPQEKKSLTGLPVHLNGFFALSQNRRHLKWASADQESFDMHRDKAIQWNECLLEEVLPEAYARLISSLINISRESKNTKESIEAVYRCIPDLTLVDERWKPLVKTLHRLLLNENFVYLKNLQAWHKPLHTMYTIFEGQNVSEETKDCVRKVLDNFKDITATTIPVPVWTFLRQLSTSDTDYPKDIYPQIICDRLRTEDIYDAIASNEKLKLLEYIMQDETQSRLKDLKLLPLGNGEFASFKTAGSGISPVYLCTDEEISLFPKLEDRFISTAISSSLKDILTSIASRGTYQLRLLTDSNIVDLLKDTIEANFGLQDPVILESSYAEWLKGVWIYLSKRRLDMKMLANVPLMPFMISDDWVKDWESANVRLFRLGHKFLLKCTSEFSEIERGICSVFDHFRVITLPCLPEWIEPSIIENIFYPTQSSILQLLNSLEYTDQDINDFNNNSTISGRGSLVSTVVHDSSRLSKSAVDLLKRLRLFPQLTSFQDSEAIHVSVTDNQSIAPNIEGFRVRFPKPLLVLSTNESLTLAKYLGASVINEVMLVITVFHAIQTGQFSNDESARFMEWVLCNITRYTKHRDIITLASSIPFVPNGVELCKPTNLFDPRDEFLQSLFLNENVFPIGNFCLEDSLNSLKFLGLRTKTCITESDLLRTANIVDSFSEGSDDDIRRKASALFQQLEDYSSRFTPGDSENSLDFFTKFGNLKCIPHTKDKPSFYPSVLPWKGSESIVCRAFEAKSMKHITTSGSVIPLVHSTSTALASIFKWSLPPSVKELTEQLEIIISAYSSDNKPEILRLVTDIYNALNSNSDDELKYHRFQTLLKKNCIWWGDGFCLPTEIFLEKEKDDIDLQPFMYFLPAECQPVKNFFRRIGCNLQQDIEELIHVQYMVSKKYEDQPQRDCHEVRKDLNLILQILFKLFQEKDKLLDKEYDILFPVQKENDESLVLKPKSKCVYCDCEWETFEEDDLENEIMYIHEDVPSYIAEGLGVTSLRHLIMSDVVGFEEWGQDEPLTRRLNRLLLEDYPDGLSVPKEIIQNADDAGATEVRFLYDERENLDARTQLLDDGMAQVQGPALWAYNDSVFTKDDLVNITRLSGATKESDTTKIGRFGLGFCAVYNLTDVPSFVTGEHIVIFDPHTKYLGKALPGKRPGLKINLQKGKNIKMVKRLKNQFKPYQGVFGCDLSMSDTEMFFPGTLFRFPLRTPLQALSSDIKDASYSREEVLRLLKLFVEASGNLLLFTQHVKKISLHHIPQSEALPSEAVTVCVIKKETDQGSSSLSVLDICSERKQKQSLAENPLNILHKVKISVDCAADTSLIHDIQSASSECSWLVSWSSGTSSSLEQCCNSTIRGTLPLGSIAMLVDYENERLIPRSVRKAPYGFYTQGHMFCYLPLPSKSYLNVHVNGSFAVTSDRTSLRINTEDDKNAYDTSWNEALLGDAVVRAFVHLLLSLHDKERFHSHTLSPDYKFYRFWPVGDAKEMNIFKKKFYKGLINLNYRVFESRGEWIGFSECIFLEKSINEDKNIGPAARKTVETFRVNKNCLVVDLPADYLDELLDTDASKVHHQSISGTKFFIDIFLPNIKDSYWDEGDKKIERNKLMVYCLDHSNTEVDNILRSTECIPSSSQDCLRKPDDLIHPEGHVADMFLPEDGRFPEKSFINYKTLSKLEKLGMMKHEIKPALILDRAKSVNHLASTGKCDMAQERCKRLVKYLDAYNKFPQDIWHELKDIAFLPVLQKPATWPFTWKSDAGTSVQNEENVVCFTEPKNLFLDDCKELVSCLAHIIDDSTFHGTTNLLIRLGVSSVENVNVEMVIKQLLTIARDTQGFKNKKHKLLANSVCSKIYGFLNAEITSQPHMKEIISQTLHDRSVLYLDTEFLPASKVAFVIGHDCTPDLYGIGQNEIGKFRDLLITLGVKEHFNAEDIVQILKNKKSIYNDTALPEGAFLLIRNLIQCLSDIMVEDKMSFHDIVQFGEDNIVVPDTDMILRPTYQLCFDECDDDEEDDTVVIYVHGQISRTVAENLGVRTKARKSLEESTLDMIPFEQKEELVTRLHNLLAGYPCDTGIMKELIQNADDAGATEIHFVKDFRKLSCVNIFDESFAEFQGPALCVFNNSSFSQLDLIGIQNLGRGSKSEDPAKTGQYGVGFNVVYNLTDLPSFLTKGPELEDGETLCMFDPLHKYSKRRVGWRYKNMKAIRKAYPDVLAGYCEDNLFGGAKTGTVFRFPLRISESKISSYIPSKASFMELFDKFRTEALDILLFLKSVTKITVSSIFDETVNAEWSQSVTLDDDNKQLRCAFSKSCKEAAKRFAKDRLILLNSPPFQGRYELEANDKIGGSKSWLIVQNFGLYNDHVPPDVTEAFQEGNLGMLPIGGVAVSIPRETNNWCVYNSAWQTKESGKKGKVYCFLPLLQQTGLSMHINGHFVLHHETRRCLWVGDEGYKPEWNRLLLSNNVAEAYVDALKFLKDTIFTSNTSNPQVKVQIDERITMFEHFLPIAKDITDKNWKSLVESIFKLIVDKNEKLFPVVMKIRVKNGASKTLSKSDQYECLWYAFHEDGHRFPTFFVGPESSLEKNHELLDLLKNIGLKICNTSSDVQASMADTGYPCKVIKPSDAVNYLKSDTFSEVDTIKVGSLPCSIRASCFQSKDNISRLLRYCKETGNLGEELGGLPLLVTNDDALRYFDRTHPVFCTKYCWLFEQSSDRFVHSFFIKQIENISKNANSEIIKELRVTDLANMLSDEVDSSADLQETFCTWIAEGTAIPNKNWLSTLWVFVIEDFEVQREKISSLRFEKHIETLDNWCLIPVLKDCNVELLMKIDKAKYILDLESFTSRGILEETLKKLGLPVLDKKHIPENVLAVLASLLVKSNNPVSFLDYLLHYRKDVNEKRLKRQECSAILRYFSENLDALKSAVGRDCKLRDTLKSLPLFCLKSGACMSLDGKEDNVFVLPSTIPMAGLEKWAEGSNFILLNEDYSLENLYKFLGFSVTEIIDMYLHIADKWQSLPLDAMPVHLKYIKEHLLSPFIGCNGKQKSLIRTLTFTPVIPCKYICKRASDFFSPHQLVFKTMLQPCHFPPDPFDKTEWKFFMEKIGIKTEVTWELFIMFATKIANEATATSGRKSVEYKGKSKILLNYLLTSRHHYDLSVYKKISRIPFIPPHIVDEEYRNVYEQYNQTPSFVCFANSVSYRYELMCWSTVTLLPKEADPLFHRRDSYADQLEALLDIHHKPPADMIIQHYKHAFESLKRVVQDEAQRINVDNWLESFLEVSYKTLQNINISVGILKRELYKTPLVFIDKADTFVPAYRTVEDLSDNQEIPPYIFRAPNRYGKYFPLFRNLGAAVKPSFMHYVTVLSSVKRNIGNQQLGADFIGDLGVVRACLNNLFTCLNPQNVNETIFETPPNTFLYLPSRERYLTDATKLIVVDNKSMEQRLQSAGNIEFFIGFKKLNLSYKIDAIRWLPKSIRPQFLSDVVKEELIRTGMQIQDGSLTAVEFKTFLNSKYFEEGLLRLMKHFRCREGSELSCEDEERVVSFLRHTRVDQVSGLKTSLVLDGNRVPGSEKESKCFLSPHKISDGRQFGTVDIYFQKGNESYIEWLQDIDIHLIEYISHIKCAQIPDKYIIKLFQRFRKPCSIPIMLDDLKIDAYDLPMELESSVFPKPGSYVPKELHHLLNCDFTYISPHEYDCVAMELEDSGLFDNETVDEDYCPVYIYVRIEREIPTGEGCSAINQKYEIYTGTTTLIVQGFQLYKFLRPNEVNSNRELTTSVIVSSAESGRSFEGVSSNSKHPSEETEPHPTPRPESTMTLKEAFASVRQALLEAWKLPEVNRRRVIKRLYLKWHPDKNKGNEEFCTKVFRYVRECVNNLERGIPMEDEQDDDRHSGPQSDSQSKNSSYSTSSQYHNFFERMNRRGRSHGENFQKTFASDWDSHFRFFAHFRRGPYHDYGEADRWQRQAKLDLTHAVKSMDRAGEPPTYNWICYVCHQAVEKSLKAAAFAKDANIVNRYTHDLRSLADGLTESIRQLVSRLSSLLGEHTRMRYPDSVYRSKIPSTVYGKTDAEQACEIAENILDLVSREYLTRRAE